MSKGNPTIHLHFTRVEKSFPVQFLEHCRDRKFTTGVRIDFFTRLERPFTVQLYPGTLPREYSYM